MEDHRGYDKEEIFSKKVKAGKRTYFFDVKSTRSNDYYLTITESKRRMDGDNFSYEKHKIFLYKEDFNKFVKGLSEVVDYVKTELMPDFDFDAFNHDIPYEGGEEGATATATLPSDEIATVSTAEEVVTATSLNEVVETPVFIDQSPAAPVDNGSTEEVDKW